MLRAEHDEVARIMKRQEIEREIAKKVIEVILHAGYAISVNDGEETTVKRSVDKNEIFGAMFTTDEDYLMVHSIQDAGGFEPKHFGWVWFIYGNSGWDVISDHTTNLEDVLKPATDFAQKFEG